MELLLRITCFAIVNLVIVLVGYAVIKNRLVLLSWIMFLVSIGLVYQLFASYHPVLRMLTIIATTFTTMKAIAVTESYKNKPLTLKFYQWSVFAVGWAGMRAEPFETLGNKPLPGGWSMIRFGISRVVVGILFVLLARQIFILHLNTDISYILISGTLLVGLSLILHFGLLSISAGMWRLSGVNTYYLFRQPAKAISLTEFWSKRWNIAFSEMTSIAIFRPLRKKIGAPSSLMLAFMFSGLLHELALSVPVNNGYGLPMLYFIIQGLLVLTEKLLIDYNILFLRNRIIARVWVFCWLVLPMPLLFHVEFIKQIVWPLLTIKF